MPSFFQSTNEIWKRRHDGAPVFMGVKAEAPKKMESKSEQLATTLIDGVKAFEAKVEEATAFFNQQLKEGHETIDAVVDHGRKLGTGISRLKAALGGLTNGGPPLVE
jgi:aconitase A